MKTSPDPDPDFESLLRRQASRLAAPDPAWREEVLHAALTSSARRASSRRRRNFYVWGSLAACWMATLLLNWSAERETSRYAHYANAQAAVMALSSNSSAILLAMSSR
ncbi:MAG: hypothetical protein V4675_23875 [Verrucomicrobiota bacterium]